MTPEKDMERIVSGVCPDCGHWPYTRKSDLFVGWKPGPVTPVMAGARMIRAQVGYDLIVIARRGEHAQRVEALRYRLLLALLGGGWKLEGPPGPETYDDQGERFLWPMSVVKSFSLDAQGLPVDPAGDRRPLAAETDTEVTGDE